MANPTQLDKTQDDQERKHHDVVAEYVMDAFERARQHRENIGLTDTITDCLRRYRGKYSSDELCSMEGITNFRGLTGMLVRSAFSWLKDAYFNAQDRPWTLEPTPDPELPERLQQQLDEAINKQIEEFMAMGEQDLPKSQKDYVDQLKNTASYLAMQMATEATKGMTNVIEDQLLQSDWRDILTELLLDVCIYPIAVLKGPIIRNKITPVWVKNTYKFKKTQAYYIERVDPLNFYPSPDSTNTQDGEFIIEIMSMSRARLIEAADMKNFDKNAIKLAIANSDFMYKREAELGAEDTEMTELDGKARSDYALDGSLLDVYEFNGRISGYYLLQFLEKQEEADNALESFDTVYTDWGEIDPYEDYEAIIWVCNNVTVMARLNEPNPIPYRPYYVTSAFRIPGSIYGECIPMVISDVQDELNMAARSRIYNMAMSSGPIIEVDVSRFPEGEVPESIKPWDIIPVKSNTMQNNNAKKVLDFSVIPSVASSLTAVMEEAWDKAHKISGIPPYMYGDSGQGPMQTLGEFSLQYAAATKGIKTIIANIDADIIEKMIQQFYYYNMYYSNDDSIKADAKVNVRGAAGLIAQEQRQARPMELLQALGPVLSQLQPETALALANQTLTESGYDPKSLSMANGSMLQQEAANRQVGVQQPQLDGRSGQAQVALNNQQTPAPVQGTNGAG